jgi:hypothetical protein
LIPAALVSWLFTATTSPRHGSLSRPGAAMDYSSWLQQCVSPDECSTYACCRSLVSTASFHTRSKFEFKGDCICAGCNCRPP